MMMGDGSKMEVSMSPTEDIICHLPWLSPLGRRGSCS